MDFCFRIQDFGGKDEEKKSQISNQTNYLPTENERHLQLAKVK
jgi:hypothetical protein